MSNVGPTTNEDLMRIINTLRACKMELEKECAVLRDKNNFFKSLLAKKDDQIKRLLHRDDQIKRLEQKGGIEIKVDKDNKVTISIL